MMGPCGQYCSACASRVGEATAFGLPDAAVFWWLFGRVYCSAWWWAGLTSVAGMLGALCLMVRAHVRECAPSYLFVGFPVLVWHGWTVTWSRFERAHTDCNGTGSGKPKGTLKHGSSYRKQVVI